jgi:hypothetical protein
MQGHTTAAQYYGEAPFSASEEDLPLFEDAHSIQMAIRQVASLLIHNKIEHKTASLLLYSMQLALMNLKMMQAEKPHPARLAVDTGKYVEMMPKPEPESAPVAPPAPPVAPEVSTRTKSSSERKRKKDEPTEEEIQKQLEYLLFVGRHLDDPGDTVPGEEDYHRLKDAVRQVTGNDPPEEKIEELKKYVAKAPSPKLPPGSIQASAIQASALNSRRHTVGSRRSNRENGSIGAPVTLPIPKNGSTAAHTHGG